MDLPEPANDQYTPGSGSVFKDLHVAPTEEEWEALCAKHGSRRPYPFAKVVRFPSPTQQQEKE